MDNTHDDITNDMQQLIFNFLAGKTTVDEEQKLQGWIGKDPENSTLFKFYRDIWLATSSISDSNFSNISEAWAHVESKLGESENKTTKKHVMISGRGLGFFLKVAAFVIFIFLSGFYFSRIFVRNIADQNICNSIVSTPLASKSHIILPDSTEVWLNAGSTLTYSANNNETERHVDLQGEAYFNVKTDKSRPFIVELDQLDIKALGTSFNVKAYPEDNFITTTLIEGALEVETNIDNNPYLFDLKPYQYMIVPLNGQIDPDSVKIKDVDDDFTHALVSWKENQWTIQGEPLDQLAVLLERKYNIKVHIVSDALKDYRFSGTIQNETFEQVLDILRYTTPLKYKIGKGEVWWDIDPVLAKNYTKILNTN